MLQTERRSDKPIPMANSLEVWDIPTRIFHWALVMLIATSWVAVDQGMMQLHLWSGSAVLTLLLFRLVWGIVGSTTARFSDFVTGPRTVIAYLRALTREDKPRYAGHNPAGGWMVVALIVVLSAQVATGLFSNDGVNFQGPLALGVTADVSDRITAIHGVTFDVLLLLVYLHLVAVFFYFFVEGENLITPMLTGRKVRSQVPEALELRSVGLAVALLLLFLAAAIAWLIVRD